MAAYAQSGSAPVSVSASKGSGKKAGPTKLTSVSIDVVENGYIGRVRYEGKRDKGGFPMYEPEKDYALADRKAVDSFLDDMLGLGAKTEPKKK